MEKRKGRKNTASMTPTELIKEMVIEEPAAQPVEEPKEASRDLIEDTLTLFFTYHRPKNAAQSDLYSRIRIQEEIAHSEFERIWLTIRAGETLSSEAPTVFDRINGVCREFARVILTKCADFSSTTMAFEHVCNARMLANEGVATWSGHNFQLAHDQLLLARLCASRSVAIAGVLSEPSE